MRLATLLTASVAAVAVQAQTNFSNVCNSAYVQSRLPVTGFYNGITIDNTSVTANVVQTASVMGNNFYPDANFTYCNVSFAYSHNGRTNDRVNVVYWLPSPANFQNRFLSTGGGGYAINSGNNSLPGGIIYGAAAGATDGGFGGFKVNVDAVNLLANGSLNYQANYMFAYQGIHEMTVIGKQFTRNFFNMTNSTKLYSYYQGCSEGGREGWSQLQRYGDQFDGAAIAAPAFRYAFQQVQHLWSSVVEQTFNYYPPTCELQKILNETIRVCDPLDGLTDGVVARSDLCKLRFNISSLIGQPYSCGPQAAIPFPPAPAAPAQNGTVTPLGVAVCQRILDGMVDSQGRQVYLSYQPGASFADGVTQYNTATQRWELIVSGLGGEWVARWLQLLNVTNLPNLQGVTYDTLRGWVYQGWQQYQDSLQTTWPDLTPFQSAGGKVLHIHGEADDSIPAASSVRYWESVRQVMYPGMSYNASAAMMNNWYKLYLVPGGAHCSPNPRMVNGPWPQTTLQTVINWVERNSTPSTLNGTVLQPGPNKGQVQQICGWPLRPLWSGNNTSPNCVYDQMSINTWMYNFTSFQLPVY